MKTKPMIIAAMVVLVGIVWTPMVTAQTGGSSDYTFQNTADNSVQMQCGAHPKGQQSGPRDGTKGENAPRDGRGNGGRKGNRTGLRDGSGNGARQGQGGGPRDGTGPNCQKG
jgi:hypothetical protein